MEKKTPLYDIHVEEGGKIVPFAGYLLPVQYAAGVIKEHMAVREACGLFDVSHMGEITFKGAGALASLNHLLTNDFTNLAIGKARYSVMCYENGTTVDDVIVYRFGEDDFLVVVNASNKDKDFAHMSANILDDTDIQDISDSIAQLALQGPKATDILTKIANADELPQKYYSAVRSVNVAGMTCMVSTTGYTGEAGYEIYTAAENAPALWRALREAGEEFGLLPCGLGARDTLRMEAAMPLYGHEMDETITPLEAGLGFGVKLGKEEFIGKQALVDAGEPKRERIGLWATGRGIMREHQDVYVGDACIGHTTSGTHCPYLKHAVAMALVETGSAPIGSNVEVDVRGKRVAAEVVALPFYKRS